MQYLLGVLFDFLFVEVLGGLFHGLAPLGVMLVRRCDWESAVATVAAWEERANRPISPRRGAITWAIIGGALIVVTAVLVGVVQWMPGA
jgi:hypothetical protein